MYGVLAGLLLGLIVAAGVAFYVVRAPMPFVDKASHDTPSQQARLPDPRQAPDPNGGLYGRDGAAGTAPSGPTATSPSPLPGVAPATPPDTGAGNDLDALIAGLPQGNAPAAGPAPTTRAPATGTTATPVPGAGATAARTPAPSAAPSTPKPVSSGSYLLQAGAFRTANDAESLRARIILLGLPAVVQRAEVNGAQVNRVRVGPFSRLDDMNRARSQLGENKIESAVVRQ